MNACFAKGGSVQEKQTPTRFIMFIYLDKTCTMFLSSYRNMSGSLGEQEMLWENDLQVSVVTAFSSSPNLS